MYKVLPAGLKLLYIPDDLSVIIPHIKTGVDRIKWFIPQYVKATYPDVVKNTYLVTDPDDAVATELAKQYGINLLVSNDSWSTSKIKVGLDAVKTRLVARIHNDVGFHRKDWVEALISHFNELEKPQLIGELHNTGDFDVKWMDEYFKGDKSFNRIRFKIEPTIRADGVSIVGTEYLHAYFMASQTYVLRGLWTDVMRFDNGKHGKEDCYTTFFSTFNQVQVVRWHNMRAYLNHTTPARGAFNPENYNIQISEEPLQPDFREKEVTMI